MAGEARIISGGREPGRGSIKEVKGLTRVGKDKDSIREETKGLTKGEIKAGGIKEPKAKAGGTRVQVELKAPRAGAVRGPKELKASVETKVSIREAKVGEIKVVQALKDGVLKVQLEHKVHRVGAIKALKASIKVAKGLTKVEI